jgi:Major intrinsic protein
MKFTLGSRLTAEFIGTAFLVAAVVGSGVMGEKLAGGNVAVALLANTIATGAALVALILTFAAVSGAHFNPVVTLVDALGGNLRWKDAAAYAAVQVTGGICGTVIAHLMFGLSVISVSRQNSQDGSIMELRRVYRNGGINAVRRWEIETILKNPPFPSSVVASLYARLGERDKAIEYLQKAYENRDGGMLLLNSDPSFDAIRSDPRFQELVRRVGLQR